MPSWQSTSPIVIKITLGSVGGSNDPVLGLPGGSSLLILSAAPSRTPIPLSSVRLRVRRSVCRRLLARAGQKPDTGSSRVTGNPKIKSSTVVIKAITLIENCRSATVPHKGGGAVSRTEFGETRGKLTATIVAIFSGNFFVQKRNAQRVPLHAWWGGIGQFKALVSAAPERPRDWVVDSTVRSLCPVLCPPPNPTKCYRLSGQRLKALLDKASVTIRRRW